MIVIANKGDRLDQIVFSYLGSLSKLEEVLENNKHLKSKLFLDQGDEITLPSVASVQIAIEDSLW